MPLQMHSSHSRSHNKRPHTYTYLYICMCIHTFRLPGHKRGHRAFNVQKDAHARVRDEQKQAKE